MILTDLIKHQRLAAKRHPMFEKNRFGKFFTRFMAIFWIGYLIFISILLKMIFTEIFPNMEPYHILNKGIFLLLALDFILRFSFQKAPTQEIKPYLLLPIGKNKLLNFLLAKSIFSLYNLTWLSFILPFGILTITKYYGISGVIFYVIGFWLLALVNNYWYLICRTLINEKIYYVAIPIILYALLGIIEFTLGHPISTFTMNLGEGFILGNPFAFLGVIGLIAVLWLINRKILNYNLYAELAKVTDDKIKTVSEYKFLERYGEIGEYFRLELKMLFRNKKSKGMFMKGCLLILFLTAMLFTPAYEGVTGKSFICIYNFAVLGILMLSHIMSFEGNYLDGLMSRKESIYVLLRAKYYFYSICAVVPFILMIPAIILDKISWLMAFSYFFFTIGFIYCILFQLAVYNNKTTPLNENLIGKQTNSGFQTFISFSALGLPIVISGIVQIIWGEIVGSWILLITGIILMLTSHFWIKNIYNRFMKRRYINMEGFRDSR